MEKPQWSDDARRMADAVTLAVAMFLAKNDEVDSVVAVADGE